MEKLYIIIPACNESETIEEVIKKVKESSTPGFNKEIIVVNDGSTDNTLEILEKLKLTYKFSLITHPKNKGKGFAIRSALGKIKEGVVLIQDADLEYDPANYQSLLQAYDSEKQPVIYGKRGRSQGYLPYIWGNMALNLLFNLLFRTSLNDIYTGHKVFRHDILKNANLERNDFSIEGEMTAKTVKAGHPIKEIPIEYHPRTFKEGKKIRAKDGLIGLGVILKNRLEKNYYTFFKYTMGGALSYAIRIGITAFLTEAMSIYYLHSYIAALIIAAIVGFYYSAYITFNKTSQKLWRGTKFALTWIAFHFFDAFLVWLLTDILGIYYVFSITAIAVLLFILKFFWFKKLVFN